MQTRMLRTLWTLALSIPLAAKAGLPVQANPDQQAMLKSNNATLAENKRVVYDFWREVLEGGHLDLANKYLTESYIQHNPQVPTGRAGFVNFFSQFSKPSPISAKIAAPLVAIVAEGNLVILSFAQTRPEPDDAAKRYTTTWFDMFRVENGKIAEHWDPAVKEATAASAEAEKAAIHLTADKLSQYLGDYKVTSVKPSDDGDIPADMMLRVTAQDEQLALDITGTGVQTAGPVPFLAKDVDEFIRPKTGSRITFAHDGNGKVSQIVVLAGGITFTGIR